MLSHHFAACRLTVGKVIWKMAQYRQSYPPEFVVHSDILRTDVMAGNLDGRVSYTVCIRHMKMSITCSL